MSEIEVEIVKATKVKEASFKARQDYLAALVRGIDKLDNDKWDNLSDEAVAWHAAAVAQMDKKRQIEDFANAEFEETTNDDATGSEDVDRSVQTESESSTDSAVEIKPLEGEEQTEEVEEKKPPKQPKAKKVKGQPSPDVKPGDVERYGKITGEKDRFGITVGTKTHDAVKMYATPDGATLKQTGDKLGGRHYNILAKLAKDGHKVEKLPGGVWRVSHKDDKAGGDND